MTVSLRASVWRWWRMPRCRGLGSRASFIDTVQFHAFDGAINQGIELCGYRRVAHLDVVALTVIRSAHDVHCGFSSLADVRQGIEFRPEGLRQGIADVDG